MTKTVGTTTQDHLRLLKWAVGLAEERLWAIEDCRHLTRRLERDLIAAGESVVRVSPKLMAHVRDSARSYGKSDPIDALAVARAALREPDLPIARLDGVERELRLLVDHREDLVAERTRIISRLRWHLHELDPGWIPPAKLERHSAFDKVDAAPVGSQRRRHGPPTGAAAGRALAAADRRDRRTHRRDHRPSHHDRSLAAGHRGLRGADRRKDHRGNRPRGPFPLQRRLRPSQWHRAATGVVVEQTTASLVT